MSDRDNAIAVSAKSLSLCLTLSTNSPIKVNDAIHILKIKHMLTELAYGIRVLISLHDNYFKPPLHLNYYGTRDLSYSPLDMEVNVTHNSSRP